MKARISIASILIITILMSLAGSALASGQDALAPDKGGLARDAEEAFVFAYIGSDNPAQSGYDDTNTAPVQNGKKTSKGGTENIGDDDPTVPSGSDIYYHWARETLQKGLDDGLIQGYGDGLVHPDDHISVAQIVTILTRLLNASQGAESSVPSGLWYYEAAQKAVKLGLIDKSAKNLDGAASRQNAFTIIAKAFSLIPASPDLTVLNKFSDAGSLKPENKAAVAALVSKGYVQGAGGALNVDSSLTRAEFLTIIYRIVSGSVPQEELTEDTLGGVIVAGDLTPGAIKASGPLWLDCSCENVSLSDISVSEITIRSHSLETLEIKAPAKIGTLIIDCGSASLAPGSLEGVSIDTLRLQGGGALTLEDSVIDVIEITGNNQAVSIGGTHKKLIVSGSNNSITLLEGARVDVITVTGSKNVIDTENNHVSDGADRTSDVSLGKITFSGYGNKARIATYSSIEQITVSESSGWFSFKTPELKALTISGSYNTFYCVGGASSSWDAANELSPEQGSDGYYARVNSISVTGADNVLFITPHVKEMRSEGRKNAYKGSGLIDKLTLNASGCTLDEKLLITELSDNSRQNDIDRVLALVTHKYAGNYTLEWAQTHDYQDYEKETWVDAKGYSSKTQYLIWINVSMQRVNIFQGSQGNWSLIRSSIVGTGAPGTGTPAGVYYTTYKLASGWTTSTYTCRPVVGFKQGSGYAFHSRLYYPNSTKLTDPSIGFPVSLGCIRMYDEVINCIYNDIPLNTTVVVH